MKIAPAWRRSVGAIAAALAAGALLCSEARAQSPTQPAALVVFPYVTVDEARHLDTHIELANTDAEPLALRCVYEDLTAECIEGSGSCMPGATCSGRCLRPYRLREFRVHLTPDQPLGWRAGSGLSAVPLDGETRSGPNGETNQGTRVPALGRNFVGTLRCVVVEPLSGVQRDRNALIGTATLVSFDPDSGFDAAQYTAVGLPSAFPATVADDLLVLGGAHAEYAACGEVLTFTHPFDDAGITRGAEVRTVQTRLALASCSLDVDTRSRSVAQFLVFNEFRQRFSTSRPVPGQLVQELSRIDSNDTTRSIFFVGVAGTLAGSTVVQAVGSGIVGVAVESHTAVFRPPHSAAVELAAAGYHYGRDLVSLQLQPSCQGDCDGDGRVTIDELMIGVSIGLGRQFPVSCQRLDADENERVAVSELVAAVHVALNGCAARPTPLPEPSEPPGVPVPSPSTIGPRIVHFGLASADGVVQAASGEDAEGRPVFTWPHGQGFTLVIEAQRGTDGRPVGATAFNANGLPDLQVIASRPLGDGSAAVCDADLPAPGGVPAVEPFAFSSDPVVVDAINDLGCRADNGGSDLLENAFRRRPCTRAAGGTTFARVDPAAEGQFCISIARAWAFSLGDTIVAARVRAASGGETSEPAEIVVRIGRGQ